MQRLDISTVNEVELTAPGYCEQDTFHLKRKLQRGEIFGAFSSSERETIWNNMLSVSADRLIPSFRAFFDDVNYLQGPADCMKRIVSGTRGTWISRSFRRAFTGVNQKPDRCIVQTSRTQFESRPGNSSDQVESGLRHMWISAMRDHREIPAQRKKIAEDRLAKSELKEDETILCAFGSLAYQMGFETKEIHEVMQRSADREIARNALLKARKPEHYHYDTAEFNLYIDKIVGFFSAASKVSKTTSYNPGKGLPNRSGHPKELDHVEDQKILFMDNLHCPVMDGCGVTSFFVRRSVYLAFFGYPSETPDTQRGRDHTPDQRMTTQHVGAIGGDHAHIEKIVLEEVRQEGSQDGTIKPVQEPGAVIYNQQVQPIEANGRTQEAERQPPERPVRQNQEEVAKRVQEGAERPIPTPLERISRTLSSRVEKRRTHIMENDIQRLVQRNDIAVAAKAGDVQHFQDVQAAAQAAEAQRIQEAQAAAQAAEAQRIQDVETDVAAENSQRIQGGKVQRKVRIKTPGLQEDRATEGFIRAQEKKGKKKTKEKNEKAKHLKEEANRVQTGILEGIDDLIQERSGFQLEQSRSPKSKIRTTQISMDESEAYETAQEEKMDGHPAEQENHRALRQRGAALQTAQENDNRVEKRTELQEREKGVLRSPEQGSAQSTSLRFAPPALVGKQKRSTRICLEDIQAQGNPDASQVHTPRFQSVEKVIPQKRTRDYVSNSEKLARIKTQHLREDKVTIEIMVRYNGDWVVVETVSASSHDTWFEVKGYGDKWELRDSAGKQLTKQTCFEDVIQDGTHKIHLVPMEVDPSQRPNRSRLGIPDTHFMVRSNVASDNHHLLKVD